MSQSWRRLANTGRNPAKLSAVNKEQHPFCRMWKLEKTARVKCFWSLELKVVFAHSMESLSLWDTSSKKLKGFLVLSVKCHKYLKRFQNPNISKTCRNWTGVWTSGSHAFLFFIPSLEHDHHKAVRIYALTGEVHHHDTVQVLGQVRGQNLGENVSVTELIRYETV